MGFGKFVGKVTRKITNPIKDANAKRQERRDERLKFVSKKCPICNNKFRRSEGEKLDVLGRYELVCINCYDAHLLKKQEKDVEYDNVCNKCGATMQKVEIIDKEIKIGFYCHRCKKTWSSSEVKIIPKAPFTLSDITIVKNKTKSEISLYYVEAQMVDTKIFVSKKGKKEKSEKKQNEEDFQPIETKDKKKPILKNRIGLEIELSKEAKTMTTWNKTPTSYDFHDNFGLGYSLTIAFSEPDNVLMTMITPIVRAHGFGIIPGKQWSHCHLADQKPTIEKAENILAEITNSISSELKKFVS